MEKRRRKVNSEIAISLFSFQDIITCLSGIMILLVLMMALDIASVKLEDDKKNSYSLTQKKSIKMEQSLLKEKIKSIKKIESETYQEFLQYKLEQEKLKDILLSLKNKNRSFFSKKRAVAFIPAKGSSPNQKAVLIECSAEFIKVGKINDDSNHFNMFGKTGKSSMVKIFSTDRDGIGNFFEHLKNFDKVRDYPVFIIKPSAAKYAMQLINKVQTMGFDVGYDAMIENENVYFE